MPRPDRDNDAYREANRKYQNEWYHRNKGSALESRRKRYKALREQFRDYKRNKRCSKCGEFHIACLEFHHPDPTVKDGDPSNLVTQRGWTWERLKAELDTFEVLCANCHRKLHWPE